MNLIPHDLLHFVTLENAMGLLGGIFFIASISMKTLVPLRVAGIASAFFFLLYGVFSRSIPAIFLYAVLVPLNSIRLYQMLELVKKVRAAAGSDLSMNWLEPFMTRRKYQQGSFLFRKGDPAEEMFLVVKGRYRVPELGIEFVAGQIFGELGLLTPGNQRTQSVECSETGAVLAITYDKVRELYFENPEFGFYLLQLISGRLLREVARLEQLVAIEHAKH
jgi:hypothetical protein